MIDRADLPSSSLTEASKAPAISRAAAVLRLLGKSESPLGVQFIARELGLVPSTCLHILRALVAEEFVAFNPDTKRYSLEAGVLTLARQWLNRDKFVDLAQPLLDNIARIFNVTVVGGSIVGLEHIIVVAASQSSPDFHLSAQIGSSFPTLIGATGRCFAAFGGYSEADLEARFKTLRWDEAPSFEEWNAQIAQTRRQGFAVDEGNYLSGVTVIAAPVWSGRATLGHTLVALGISSVVERTGFAKLQEAILSAAQTLSSQLGGAAPGEPFTATGSR